MSENVREMTRFERWRERIRVELITFRRRRIPYLVWWGDEIDVRVVLMEDKLPAESSIDQAFSSFYGSGIRDVEMKLYQMGVTFDTGMGYHGRDWEWDFSLSGPISVTFKGAASRPERRKEKFKPRLVGGAA